MATCHCSRMRLATRRVGGFYDRALATLGINGAQYNLLLNVQVKAPVSLTDLGRRLDLDRSTLGRNVRVVERMGLVVVGHAQTDRREASVSLTEAGQRTIDQALPIWQACQQHMEETLGPERLRLLDDIAMLIQAAGPHGSGE